MKAIRIAIVAAAALLMQGNALRAQTNPDELIRENPERAAAVHHSYEYHPSADTPAPAGFKPFYVSHYGRHGSRRNLSGTYAKAYECLTRAHEAGILTPLGEEALADVKKVYDEHVDMVGDLTTRGGREHREIAERLYKRVPRVFRQRTEVDVQSSNIPRCLLSMANFTASLDDCAPQLKFSYITGARYINLLAHDYYKSPSSYGRKLQDSLLRADFNPDRLINSLFKGTPEETAAVIGNPLKFSEYLYYAGSIDQCVEAGADIFDKYFTMDELITQYKSYNVRCYSTMSNDANVGDAIIWAPAQGLIQDIISRADAAMAEGSNRAADLRFGHDTGILPLAGLMGLEGPGDRMKAEEVNDRWQSFERIPMGSNLQIIFYRNRKGEVLVKFLYNEQETRIPALTPVSGPYYKWSEAKAYFEKRAAEINAKFANN
ncbi:MAG: histidine-type phosphatase [Bacteroidales bacterium]|nr:histidine-type phosphatase [Bacteroidales bacterium]